MNLNLIKAIQTCDYYVRTFYTNDPEDLSVYTMSYMWEMRNLSLDPRCLPYKSIKTKFGEVLLRYETFKVESYFLKYVGKHFVFIKDNERKVIPICSHLP